MKLFFDYLRSKDGPLTVNQVLGLEALYKATGGLSLSHRAYIMATAWHETGPTDTRSHMRPITEIGPKSYFDKYDAGTKIGKNLGNTIKGDGYKFRGRGYVQITGRANYVKFSKILGIDLVANPELALEADIASKIIVIGMAKGVFTGKTLSHYGNYRDMRRTVNGTDRADLIAGYAVIFADALNAMGAIGTRVPDPEGGIVPEAPQIAPTPTAVAPHGLLSAFLSLIATLFNRKA